MSETSRPITRRTDPSTYTPERLEGAIDYDIFEELSEFEHRGCECSVERLVGKLMAALDAAAIKRGESTEPSRLREMDAIEEVMDALVAIYPAWFDAEAVDQRTDWPVAERSLSRKDLKSRYFADEIAPSTRAVAGSDLDDQRRVVLPLVALVLEEVREQMAADHERRVEAAQAEIKQSIYESVVDVGLTPAMVDDAVEDATTTLTMRDAWGEDSAE